MFLNGRVFNSRLEKTEDRISEQKDRSMKHTQFEQQREDTLWISELTLQMGPIKDHSHHIISGRNGEKNCKAKRIFEEIVYENFSNLVNAQTYRFKKLYKTQIR